MRLSSLAPHDFWLTLDCSDYFLREQEPEAMYERGFVRPLSLSTRDVLAVVRFNDHPDEPAFDVAFPDQDRLNTEELAEVSAGLARVLGLGLDLKPLMEQAADDPLLGPMFESFYGFKRISGANVYEDAFSDIIKSRISHKPTARKMNQAVRRAFGTRFEFGGLEYFAFPRPDRLMGVEPASFREFGISERKAEYIIGLASLIHGKELSLQGLEDMAPQVFYDTIQSVRGIGPSTAQTLMLGRNRPDAVFPSQLVKGEEKGLRRWIIYSYGLPVEDVDEDGFQALIAGWKGYEALAIELLYYRWILNQLKKS